MTRKRNGVNWEGVLSTNDTNDTNYHEKTRKGTKWEMGNFNHGKHGGTRKWNGITWVLNLRAHYARVN